MRRSSCNRFSSLALVVLPVQDRSEWGMVSLNESLPKGGVVKCPPFRYGNSIVWVRVPMGSFVSRYPYFPLEEHLSNKYVNP